MIKIRKGEKSDVEGIMKLLKQVNDVHADGRPDLFIHGHTKYTPEEVEKILSDPLTPVFVAESEDCPLEGYCFCIVEDHTDSKHLRPIKTLYIDDLCVDENSRGKRVGKSLYEYVKQFASREGFYNITLNVWSCNPSALRFYEALGMTPMKIGMEEILR